MDRCRVPRGQCSLLVRGNADEVVAELEALGARSVETVDMNLEALFVAYLQGYRENSTQTWQNEKR